MRTLRLVTARPTRHRCNLPARLKMPGHAPLDVSLLDLSESGAFLETTSDVPFGDTAELVIEFPSKVPWTTPVKVTRLGSGQRLVTGPTDQTMAVICDGVGVHFVGLSAAMKDAVRSYLSTLDE